MKIKSIPYTLNLKNVFKISRSSSTTRTAYLIELSSLDSGSTVTGLGEVTPYQFYGQTLELMDESFEILSEVLKSENLPNSIEDILNIIEKIKNAICRPNDHPGRYNHIISAITSALLDMYCKVKDISILDSVCSSTSTIKEEVVFPYSSYTIGIDEPENIKSRVEDASGFKILKVKLGTSLEKDKETIKIIRDVTDLPLRVDANCGWTLDESLEMANYLEDKNVEFIEQPLKVSSFLELKELKESSELPIFLDESIVEKEDILRLKDLCDGVNIKMSKCGGLLNVLEMVKIARENNLKLMLGCMIESSIGISSAYNASFLFDYVDLDGNILISNDPFNKSGNLLLETGKVVNKLSKPGFGLDGSFLFNKK